MILLQDDRVDKVPHFFILSCGQRSLNKLHSQSRLIILCLLDPSSHKWPSHLPRNFSAETVCSNCCRRGANLGDKRILKDINNHNLGLKIRILTSFTKEMARSLTVTIVPPRIFVGEHWKASQIAIIRLSWSPALILPGRPLTPPPASSIPVSSNPDLLAQTLPDRCEEILRLLICNGGQMSLYRLVFQSYHDKTNPRLETPLLSQAPGLLILRKMITFLCVLVPIFSTAWI